MKQTLMAVALIPCLSQVGWADTADDIVAKAGPEFTRDHDSLASVSAVTSSSGRIFYILDDGEISLIHRPSKWKLIARDAFNGKLLWKRDIPKWTTQLDNFHAGPAQMPRRLVSVGDRVFVTLGLRVPVELLDPTTCKLSEGDSRSYEWETADHDFFA